MPHKDLPSYMVMFGACICIILLVAARHHPPSRQKIKEIWHGRVYWLDDNTTLTPNLRSVAPMNETVKEVQRPEPLREVTIKTVTRKIDLPSDKKSIVMMDDRPFSYWQPTLVSAIKYTSSDWGIELFVSKQYDQFALVKKFLDSTGRRTRLNHYDMHFNKKDRHRSINSLLKQETFWETIEAESIFFIQPDGVVCRNGIDEFLEYDYVGAPWAHRPDGLIQGNGGMSLRKRSFMLDCLKNYHKHDNDPEDVYFSNCAKDRGVSADLAISKRFGMEAIWSKDSITIHQLWFQPKLTLGRTKAKVFEDICAQCPEIMEIPYFQATPYFKAKFVISDGRPLLNILTRTTSSRVEQFDRLSKSIEKQTIAARHIISSEDRATDKTDMTDIFFVEHENRGTGCHKQVSLSAGKGCCPYNKHLNVLKNQVKKGWVLILDDDSLILSDTFVERLTNHLEKTKTNKIVVFPVKYGPNNRQLPAAHHIKFGDIDMANFVVHISNIRDYTFTSDCGGDFRFLKHLMQKGLEVDWFDMKVSIHANTNGAQQGVLTSNQECPCYEQRIDKLDVVGIDRRPAKFKGLFERHRMVCAVFKHKLTPNGNWLYFGPEKTHISILRQKWPDVTFTGIDYFAKGYHYEKDTLHGDVQNLYNIKSNTYDGIIILHVLEHVPSIEKALSELHRILKPGGKIIHETPCQTKSKSFNCDGHRNYLICKQFDHYWGYNCNDLHRLFSQKFSCENIEFSNTLIKTYALFHEKSKLMVDRTICTENENKSLYSNKEAVKYDKSDEYDVVLPDRLLKNGGMTPAEFQYLAKTYKKAKRVFEWGIGTSTKIADYVGVPYVVGVDSSIEWVSKVSAKVSKIDRKIKFVNIGPTKEWGYPKDDSHKNLWPTYPLAVQQESSSFDVYLVDGRFRVACACQALMHGHADSRIMLHDYDLSWDIRKHYQVVETLADLLHKENNLAVFKRKKTISDAEIRSVFEKYKFHP